MDATAVLQELANYNTDEKYHWKYKVPLRNALIYKIYLINVFVQQMYMTF